MGLGVGAALVADGDEAPLDGRDLSDRCRVRATITTAMTATAATATMSRIRFVSTGGPHSVGDAVRGVTLTPLAPFSSDQVFTGTGVMRLERTFDDSPGSIVTPYNTSAASIVCC